MATGAPMARKRKKVFSKERRERVPRREAIQVYIDDKETLEAMMSYFDSLDFPPSNKQFVEACVRFYLKENRLIPDD